MASNQSPLKIARTVAGLTQAELAEKAGLDPTYISQIERGRKQPGRHFRRAVSDALKLREGLLFPNVAGAKSAEETAD